MNAERLLNMIIRRVMQRVVFRGVDAGIDAVTKKGKGPAAQEDRPPHAQATRQQKQTARKAQRAARMASRITKL